MNRRALTLTLLSLLAVVGSAAVPTAPVGPRAQEKPQLPRFRGGANLVRVDAYPTLDGAPVRDLTANDFEVLEDGVPQKVEGFEFVQVRGAGPQLGRREPNTVREATSLAEGDRVRIFVVYLDTYFTDVTGSHRIQRSLVNMLNRVVGDDDLFAVMTPDMSARDLTLARRTVTVEGYLSKYWFWGQRGRLYPDDPVEQRYMECFPDRSIGNMCTQPGNRQVKEPDNFYAGVAKEMIQRRREKRVLDGLADLSRHLGGLREERKAVIAITNGWLLYGPNQSLTRLAPCSQPPGIGQIGTTPDGKLTTDRVRSDYGYSRYDCETDRQMLANLNNGRDFQDLMDIANANNVSFYPVDARGLAAFDRDLSETPVLAPSVEIQLVTARVETLRTLADNTDGLAVVNTNDLDSGFQRIVDDLTSYYLLGYYSTNTKLDGKVRKIKVRVKRPGVDIRARHSYRAATEAEIEQGQAEETAAAAAAPMSAVQAALNSIGSSRGGVPLRTAVSYAMLSAEGGPPRVHLWALAELDPSLLRGGEWTAGGEVDVVVASADGTRIEQRTVPLAGGKRSVSVDVGTVALPAGELVIRTRVKPSGDGLPVSDTIRIQAPTDSGAPGMPRLLRRGPTTGLEFLPTADKQFRRTDRVRVELPSSAPVSASSAEVLDRTGKPINLPVATAVRNDGVLTWATAELALAPLAAGDYALRLKTERGGQSNEVVTGFRVIP